MVRLHATAAISTDHFPLTYQGAAPAESSVKRLRFAVDALKASGKTGSFLHTLHRLFEISLLFLMNRVE
jgi:hypothetical protein